MTVFNYFTHKEDLFLDCEDDVQLLVHEGARPAAEGQSPIEALRHLVDRLCEEKHPFARIDRRDGRLLARRCSELAAQGRVREIGDETVAARSRSSSQVPSPMASRGSSPA